MSLEAIEENCLFICGHCNADVGRMNEILQEDLASKHHCLKNSLNVEMDFQTKKIYKSIPQIELNSPPEPTNSTCATTVICSTDNTSKSQENIYLDVMEGEIPGEIKCTWTHESIKLLIFSFVKHKDKFDSPLYTKKNVWKIICDELGKKGVARTYQKCDEKWRNLKKTYDKIRTEKNKTGNHSVHWRYFEDFEEIYFRDPYFEPIATVSSTGLTKTKSSEIPVEYEVESTPGSSRNLSPGEISRKRTVSSYEIEKKRQKRHEDKMNLKREMFDWMKEHFATLLDKSQTEHADILHILQCKHALPKLISSLIMELSE